jgi:hypothetical protein
MSGGICGRAGWADASAGISAATPVMISSRADWTEGKGSAMCSCE